MKRYIILTLLLSMIQVVSVSAQARTNPPVTLSFGVVPQQSATKLARLWSPIFSYLSEKTGHTIMFKTAKDIPTFEQRLAEGAYDMAYMNPYHYTMFSDAPGYSAFAKAKDTRIQGIVVVRKDSPYQTLDDLVRAGLAEQPVAFPSPGAFAASLLPRAHLSKMGISLKPAYVASHDSVYRGVARGFFIAGGGIVRTLNSTKPAIREQLRILWSTQPYTPHAIAVHPRIPVEIVERLQRAMVNMYNDPRGHPLLQAIHFQGIEPAQDLEWDDVRHLDIQLLQHLTRH